MVRAHENTKLLKQWKVYQEPHQRTFGRAYALFEAGKPANLLRAIREAPIAPYTDGKSLVIPGRRQRLKHPAAVRQVAEIRAYWELRNACSAIVSDCLGDSDVADPGLNDNIAKRMHTHLKCLLRSRLDRIEPRIRESLATIFKGCRPSTSELKRRRPECADSSEKQSKKRV